MRKGLAEGEAYRHLDFYVADSDVLNGALEMEGVGDPCFDGFEMVAEWRFVRGQVDHCGPSCIVVVVSLRCSDTGT